MTDSPQNDEKLPGRSAPTTSPYLDDTPNLLGDDVSPEMKEKVEPAKEAVKKKLREIETPEQARRVAEKLIATGDDTTELDIRAQQLREDDTQQPEKAIQATATEPGPEQAAEVLIEAARQMAGTSGEVRAALEQAIQEATNPEQVGGEYAAVQRPLDMLRDEILHRMKPLQALDARVFLTINHMPHTPLSNKFMSAVTDIMNGGFGWVLGLLIASVLDKPRGPRALHSVVPPLWFATMTVEFPIKRYFRRRRPFIDVVQAIAVGRKPGTYSFPSGHSAAAFAGAWLLRRHYPELTPLWYAIASLVGFTRIYLGAHYPGDVVSGAVSGTIIAEATRWFIEKADEPTNPPHPVQMLRDPIAHAEEKV